MAFATAIERVMQMFDKRTGEPGSLRLTAEKTIPPRGMVSALSCELKVYAGHLLGLGFWPFFGANCASRFFCSLSG